MANFISLGSEAIDKWRQSEIITEVAIHHQTVYFD